MPQTIEKTAVLEVGRGRPIPPIPENWKSVKELQLFGPIIQDDERTFVRLAKSKGVTLSGQDDEAIDYLHNDTTVESNRG